MKLKSALVIFLTLFFLSTSNAWAAFSFQINSADPSTVSTKDQEILVNLAINELPSGDSYFRVGFDNGTSYIGYIKNNNGDWVKLGSLTSDKDTQGCLNYYKINTATSSATLNLKIGSDNDLSNGTVNLKAHRFTSTCGSNTGSTNTIAVTVTLPTVTPSPSPTASPTSTATSTPTSTPTATPTKTPTPAPTKTPTPKLSATPTDIPTGTGIPTDTPLPTSTPNSNEVLAAATDEATPSSENNLSKFLPFVFIIAGLAAIGFALYNIRSGRKN